jgi:hypothetical protein
VPGNRHSYRDLLEVICNTSPIQYLHQGDLLHTSHEMYGLIAIPETFVTEHLDWMP